MTKLINISDLSKLLNLVNKENKPKYLKVFNTNGFIS